MASCSCPMMPSRYASSVFWISLRHTLPKPKVEKLTPIFLLFFTKKLKNENNSLQNFHLTSISIVKN